MHLPGIEEVKSVFGMGIFFIVNKMSSCIFEPDYLVKTMAMRDEAMLTILLTIRQSSVNIQLQLGKVLFM